MATTRPVDRVGARIRKKRESMSPHVSIQWLWAHAAMGVSLSTGEQVFTRLPQRTAGSTEKLRAFEDGKGPVEPDFLLLGRLVQTLGSTPEELAPEFAERLRELGPGFNSPRRGGER